jgi:protocatechuate 3,4-dioxygenase beta subunit
MADSATIERPAAAALATTPPQILGPFYPFMHQPVKDGDLTGGGRAQGTTLLLSGRVVNQAGAPVAGARVEVWQANAHGRYAHPNDDSTQPLDANFHGFAVVTTDADGRYAFRTVRPAAYQVAPGRWRPAHIHFSVTGKTEQLITQMYFAGEEYNATDPWLNSTSRKDGLIVAPQPSRDEPGALAVTFDIVLMKG